MQRWGRRAGRKGRIGQQHQQQPLWERNLQVAVRDHWVKSFPKSNNTPYRSQPTYDSNEWTICYCCCAVQPAHLVLPKRPTEPSALPAGPTYTKLKGHTLCMIMVHESEKMMPLWTWMGARIDPSLPTCLPAWLRYLCFGFWMSAQLNFRHDSLPPKTKRKKRTGCIKLNASTL